MYDLIHNRGGGSHSESVSRESLKKYHLCRIWKKNGHIHFDILMLLLTFRCHFERFFLIICFRIPYFIFSLKLKPYFMMPLMGWDTYLCSIIPLFKHFNSFSWLVWLRPSFLNWYKYPFLKFLQKHGTHFNKTKKLIFVFNLTPAINK